MTTASNSAILDPVTNPVPTVAPQSKEDTTMSGATSMAKQDNYKKERTETALSFHFSDFGMRGYISMVKPSGLFLRFSFSFW